MWFYDGDDDGVGLTDQSATLCHMPEDYASVGGDCDDISPNHDLFFGAADLDDDGCGDPAGSQYRHWMSCPENWLDSGWGLRRHGSRQTSFDSGDRLGAGEDGDGYGAGERGIVLAAACGGNETLLFYE